MSLTPSNPMSLESIWRALGGKGTATNDKLREVFGVELISELKRRESEAAPVGWSAEDALRRLGIYLGNLLDEDQAKTACNEAIRAASASPPSQPSTGVPDGWMKPRDVYEYKNCALIVVAHGAFIAKKKSKDYSIPVYFADGEAS